MSEMTLYEVVSEMTEAIEAWAEATDEAERTQLLTVIEAYAAEEVRKGENCYAYIRNREASASAKEAEVQRLAEQARIERRKAQVVKDLVLAVMTAEGRKKVECRYGTLAIQGNGGVQPLELDESQVPDEYCDYQATIPVEVLNKFLPTIHRMMGSAPRLVRIPRQERIREQLARPCQACLGEGQLEIGETPEGVTVTELCQLCGGDGKNHIPGAKLLERGSHVRLR